MAAMADSPSRYRAPRWLPGGNLQTLYPVLLARRPRVTFHRERWNTPDGDFIDLDWTADPPVQPAPLIVLFHGLEGSSGSHYARALMHACVERGWRGVVVHFRGCSGELNLLPRAYHSGDSAEIDWILRRLRQQQTAAPLYATGVSLGGNALLKWLGEQGPAAADIVTRAAAISAPVDLAAAGAALEHGFNMVYTKTFLATMIRKSMRKLQMHPGLFDGAGVRAARTLREFDNLVTAPLHGFRDVDDYWLRASSKPWLTRITVPTLLLNARNDPFLPAAALPAADEISAAVSALFTAEGGHVGFMTGVFPGTLTWLPHTVLGFLTAKTYNN